MLFYHLGQDYKFPWHHRFVITQTDVIRHLSTDLPLLGMTCTRNHPRVYEQVEGQHFSDHCPSSLRKTSQLSTSVLHRTQPVLLQWIPSSAPSVMLLVPTLMKESGKFQSISIMGPAIASWPKVRNHRLASCQIHYASISTILTWPGRQSASLLANSLIIPTVEHARRSFYTSYLNILYGDLQSRLRPQISTSHLSTFCLSSPFLDRLCMSLL